MACRASIRTRGGVATLAIVAAFVAVAAAPSNAEIMTLDDCVEIALTSSLTLAQAQENLAGAGAGVMSGWSGVLPRVSAGLGYSDGRTVTGGASVNSESYSGNLSLNQTLFDGGAFARLSGAHRSRNASEFALDGARRSVILSTKAAYYGLLKAMRLSDVQTEALELAREQMRKAESLYELGSASKSDFLKAQVEVKQSELALISAERVAATARLNLLYTMGVSMGTDIEVVDPADLGGDEILDFDLEEAVGRRPDVRSAEESLIASRRSLLSAKAARWPSLGLSASYSKGGESMDDVTGDFGDDYSTSTSLSLSIPIFNGLATKASIDNSKAALRSQEISVRDVRLSAAYEIETVRLGVIEQRKRVGVATVGLETAEEELRVSEERFRLRAASMLDVIYARVAYSQARVSLVEAQYDYEIAKAELKDALGL